MGECIGRVEDEGDTEEVHVVVVLVGHGGTGVEPVLKTLHVCSNVRIARKVSLVDTSAIHEETGVDKVGVRGGCWVRGWLLSLAGWLQGGRRVRRWSGRTVDCHHGHCRMRHGEGWYFSPNAVIPNTHCDIVVGSPSERSAEEEVGGKSAMVCRSDGCVLRVECPSFATLSARPFYPALGKDDDDKRVDRWTRLYQVREAARVSWKSAMAAWVAGAKRSRISRQRSLRRPLSGERKGSFDERLTSTEVIS